MFLCVRFLKVVIGQQQRVSCMERYVVLAFVSAVLYTVNSVLISQNYIYGLLFQNYINSPLHVFPPLSKSTPQAAGTLCWVLLVLGSCAFWHWSSASSMIKQLALKVPYGNFYYTRACGTSVLSAPWGLGSALYTKIILL